MTFPSKEQQVEAKRMIADHDARNFYTFNQRLELFGQSDNGMMFMPNLLCPMQVGDTLCALDNNRIPFEFDPKTSARLVRNKDFARSFEHHSTFKPRIGLEDRKPTVDDQYRALLLDIMENGVNKDDRTGVGSRSVVGRSIACDISNGQLPILSSKFVASGWVKDELLWMLSGNTNIRYLKEHGVDIWDSWVKPGTEEFVDGVLVAGELPKIYQHQWRMWDDTRIVDDLTEVEVLKGKGFKVLGNIGPRVVVQRKIDQIQKVIDTLRNNPNDRGHIVSAWNAAEVDEMALRPCHTLFQFFATKMSVKERLTWLSLYKPAGFEHLSDSILKLVNEHDDVRHETQYQNDAALRELLEVAKVPVYKLTCTLYQRSCDVALGLPFNLVQYSMLTHMVAQCVGMATDKFIWNGGDVHLYSNQWTGVLEHLDRETDPESYPTIRLTPGIIDIFDFKRTDVEVVGYKHLGKIKYPKAAV